MAERILDACMMAEDNLKEKPEPYEPRLLEIPALRICALWLYGAESLFVVLVDGNRSLDAELLQLDAIFSLG